MDVLDAQLIAIAHTLAGLPPPAFAEVAIAGRSNVGKSSLLNSLAGRRKLVRTSQTPGCTRGIGIFRIELRGATMDLVDLPGYGYARRSKVERRSWGPLVEGFLRNRPGLCGVVILVDLRRGLEEDDESLARLVSELGLGVLLVATKVDKLGSSQRTARLAELARKTRGPVIGFSATTGAGRDVLWERILDVAHVGV